MDGENAFYFDHNKLIKVEEFMIEGDEKFEIQWYLGLGDTTTVIAPFATIGCSAADGNAPVVYNSTSSNNALSPMEELPLLANKNPFILVADAVSFTTLLPINTPST